MSRLTPPRRGLWAALQGTTALLAALAAGCDPSPQAEADAGPAQPNILLVLLDDVGVDKIAGFSAHPTPTHTPTIDALGDAGMRLQRAYAYPSCSPTRAALLTGRYGRRTGVGRTIVSRDDRLVLPTAETGIPEVLATAGYTSGLSGKWHLSSESFPDGTRHPEGFGFDTYEIIMGNPVADTVAVPDAATGYDARVLIRDGIAVPSDGYLTSVQTDAAIRMATTMPEPWFLWLAYSAPHTPLHAPPDGLLAEPLPPDATPAELHAAMLEALDTELGRLLDTLPPEVRARTTIVVLGDNGTDGEATEAPWLATRAKTTLFEGGVHVPMLVSGARVAAPGTQSDALVHVVDLLPTLAHLAGIAPEHLQGDDGLVPWPLDGDSLVPLLDDPLTPGPDAVVVEKFQPIGPNAPVTHAEAALSATHKLMVDADGQEHLFAIEPGGAEASTDLLRSAMDASTVKTLAALRGELHAWRTRMAADPARTTPGTWPDGTLAP